jgi:hypothetical protein
VVATVNTAAAAFGGGLRPVLTVPCARRPEVCGWDKETASFQAEQRNPEKGSSWRNQLDIEIPIQGPTVRNRTLAYCTQSHGRSGGGRFGGCMPHVIPRPLVLHAMPSPALGPGLLRAIRPATRRYAIHSACPYQAKFSLG